MNPIIIIPARMASTRLPNKPLALIGELPMIVQVMKRVQESGVWRVIVACDCDEIKDAVTKAGGEAVLTNPDLPSGSDRIFSALSKIDPDKKHDIVINVQGDMPTLEPKIISEVLNILQNPKADIATLAAVITDEEEKTDSSVVKVAMGHGSWVTSKEKIPMTHDSGLMTNKALYFSRSLIPHGEGNYYHHIGIYGYRREALEKFVSLLPSSLEQREKLEQLRALEAGMNIYVAVVDTVPLGVDTQEGLEKARRVYEQNGW